MLIPIADIARTAAEAAGAQQTGGPWKPMIQLDLRDGTIVPVIVLHDHDDWIEEAIDLLYQEYPNEIVRACSIVELETSATICVTDLATGESASADFDAT